MTRPSSGFTLVEVLVATTVLSLVLMLTVSAMRMIGASSSSVLAVVDGNDEMRSVSLFLHDLLRRAATIGDSQAAGSGGGTWASAYSKHAESAYFLADKSSVAWLSAGAVVPGQRGRQYLRLSRDNDQLVLQSKAYEVNDESPDWNFVDSTETLVSGVTRFSVSYRWAVNDPWGVEENDDGRLPAAIKLRVQVADKYWPDMVVTFDNYSSPAGF